MVKKAFRGGGVVFILLVFLTSVSSATITTYFPSKELTNDGTVSSGIYGTAYAEVTSGTGYVDIVVTNTSVLGPYLTVGEEEGYANPYIIELEFTYADGLVLDEDNSYAYSLSDSLFAQGSGNAAKNLAAQQLYYNIVAADSAGMKKCLMTAEADNENNDNTIGSLNVLDGSDIPQEGWALGFLNPESNPPLPGAEDHGTVFDAVRFHLEFTGDAPDESYYATPGTLMVKYVGGGDYSDHQANVPEPATIAILGLGGLFVLRRRKR
ncbi:MAG: PEP-CTERM sorting domain-containing protein [Planctomycetota bacterium]|jgi:hypothetical protein